MRQDARGQHQSNIYSITASYRQLNARDLVRNEKVAFKLMLPAVMKHTIAHHSFIREHAMFNIESVYIPLQRSPS